ncbi:Ig-like domain-containing protein [Nocardioides astragali]|uniref:Ig-like domain repeat protein n=1 Tax=Nocardioides astragali TaxID=1776736 RepID=A0ABW2N0Z3_9ACTN|nr:Ig-like domain repeat protein [Nocardioides astragali]
MSPSRVRTHVRRSAAAGLTATLATVGLVATAPAAESASTSISYTCTAPDLGPDSFTLPVVLDTNAPARMAVGQSVPVTVTASAVLPGAVARAAALRPATAFEGAWTLSATFGTSVTAVPQTIARTSLGVQTTPTPVPFTAGSAPITYTAPATPGPVEITAGDISPGTLQFYNGDAAAGGPSAITCTAPPGKAPVIDTIAVVATSTTSLTLDRTASEYGQDVTATAKVTTTSGTPDGDVAFSVDGLATKAKVGKDGVATLVLPDAPTGSHSVTATFVPRDATTYDGSTSAPQVWTVAKARTRMRVPVTGRTTTVATRVGVKAKGVFDTVPTGKVRIKVKRIGKPGKWVKVRTLDDGAARAGFGRLKKGRYQVVVVYRGDANHRYLKKTKQFRVTRG